MQTAACNTPRTSQQPQQLPTPEEFDRLTANQFQRATAPPLPIDIEAGLEETQMARELKSSRAKALAAVGLESKAWRSEDCGSKRIRRCPEHHDQFEEQHRTCRLKTCAACAARLSEERIARFWDNQPYMRNLKRFHWIEVHEPSQDTMPTRDEIQAYNAKISKFIKKLGDPRPGTGVISNVFIDLSGPDAEDAKLDEYRFRLMAVIFWWGDISERDLHDAGLGCMKHFIEPTSEMNKAVKELLTIYPPKSDEVCAQIELNTKGLRLIRTHGQMLKKDLLLDEDTLDMADTTTEPVAEALVAEEGNTATYANKPASSPEKRCKRCGGQLSEVSNWIYKSTPAAELKQLKWTIMNNAPPTE